MEKFSENQVWFMLCSMAELYWISANGKIELTNYETLERDNQEAYYIKWEGLHEYSRYMTIEDIECVIECVKTYYGKTSKTYMEWTILHGEILLRNKKGSI